MPGDIEELIMEASLSNMIDPRIMAPQVCIVDPGGAGGPDAPAGLLLWLRADRNAYVSGTQQAVDTESVAEWVDSVGSYSFTEATNKPVWNASVINGNPGVLGNGTSSVLTHTGGPAPIVGQTDGSLFFVVKGNTPTLHGNVMSFPDLNAATNHCSFPWDASGGEYGGEYRVATAAVRDGPYYANTDQTTTTGSYLVEISSNDTAHSVRINNAAAATLTYENGTNTGRWIGDLNAVGGVDAITLFARKNNTTVLEWWKGWLCEACLYDHELTDAERTTFRNYINHRYAIW